MLADIGFTLSARIEVWIVGYPVGTSQMVSVLNLLFDVDILVDGYGLLMWIYYLLNSIAYYTIIRTI